MSEEIMDKIFIDLILFTFLVGIPILIGVQAAHVLNWVVGILTGLLAAAVALYAAYSFATQPNGDNLKEV
ncbi:hypothetical protein ACL1CN_10350 [Corynebacterium striatum]|uniref:hypothetical protein n=1 Tax=Corynebacterium striatum TaxID=43770 RepID=UPI003AC7AB27|nr:hypothetical protein [Corynebacterium striatum]HCG2985194.1 hypothetical protein [Corynebacterium striatum]HCG3001016.1 hypothetical protein [Corynebacterium striatum]HCG3016907.1 hypothetical protein [Corynebacterium striatum]HCG3143538.1 hypothetical protein [Corynebacterium striatum]